MTSACSCEWKGKWLAPVGWTERIVKRDPGCPVHGGADHFGAGPQERYLATECASAENQESSR
jgi:hypothetical protein